MKKIFDVEVGVPYMDNGTTTPLAEEVLQSMMPFLQESYGDPDEPYGIGAYAKDILEDSRAEMAEFVGAEPENLWFTGSGTEANNWVIKCIQRPGLPLCTEVEHLSVRAHCKTFVEVETSGAINMDVLRSLLDVGDISVLSVQLANQDTGVMQDIRAVSDLCMSVGVPLHVDASVAFGVEPIDMEEMGIDFLTLSSHKVWGPLGAGALVGNGRFQLSPLLLGGSQEKGMRAGATNMAAIIGFTTASRIMHGKRMEWNRVGRVRDKMEAQLATACNARSIGKNRLPNMSMVSFDADATFIAAEMERMHGMCVGVGGTSESGSISRVLRAMGETRTSCGGALRFRFGPWFNDNAADMIVVGASSAIREERGRKIV